MLRTLIQSGLLLSAMSLCPLAMGQSLTDMDEPPTSQPTTQITSPVTTPPVVEPQATDAAPADLTTLTIPQLLDEARAALDAKNALLAQSMVQAVFQRDEGNLEASLIDAEIATLEGDADRARKRYRMVVAVRPNDFEANLGLGRIYSRSKVYRQAMGYLERAKSSAPPERAAEAMTLLAKAYRGAGYLGKALEAVQRAVDHDPDSVESWEYLVQLRTQGEDYERALLDSDQLLALTRRKAIEQPSDRDALTRLHAAYETQRGVLGAHHRTLYQPNPVGNPSDKLLPGMEKKAAENLRRIVDLMIVQAELLRTLSYFEVRNVAERAATYDPTNVNVQIQYGLLLRNTSEIDKARTAFEKVLELDPANAEAQRQLSSLGGTSQPAIPAPAIDNPAAATPAD
jgi:tetratricopeptide (TPR) repeat protein